MKKLAYILALVCAGGASSAIAAAWGESEHVCPANALQQGKCKEGDSLLLPVVNAAEYCNFHKSMVSVGPTGKNQFLVLCSYTGEKRPIRKADK